MRRVIRPRIFAKPKYSLSAKLRRATPPFKICQLWNVDTGDHTNMYFPGMSGGGGGGSTAGLSDQEAAMVKTVGICLSQRSLEG